MWFNWIFIISLSAGHCFAIGNPKVCVRPHEHYECGSACQTTCATLGQPCKIINVACNDLCYCDEGFARDQTGTCVQTSECEDRLAGICGKNEEYSREVYYKKECAGQILSSQEVPDVNVLGCYCKNGYKRNDDGNCVRPCDCPHPNRKEI